MIKSFRCKETAALFNLSASKRFQAIARVALRKLELRGEPMDFVKVAPTHPGEILALDFLQPMGITANALAIAIGVPANRLQAIAKGRRAITADTALRLSRYFGLSEGYWVNLQARYDMLVAREALADDLAHIRPRTTPAATA